MNSNLEYDQTNVERSQVSAKWIFFFISIEISWRVETFKGIFSVYDHKI
jgi:hypothetical protein